MQIISTTNQNRINVDIKALQTMYSPRAIVVLWLDVASGALKAPFYNQTIDICSLIKNPGTHRLVQIIYRELKRNGNMPTGCPIATGLYTFHGISPGQMRFPPFFKQADFIMDIIGLEGMAKVHSIDTRWHGTMHKVKCTARERC
uniref:Uncharacterized protein n=1 Tax=Anopheles funestus TaxID=62324 RepID=A0A182RKE0_ANOFN